MTKYRVIDKTEKTVVGIGIKEKTGEFVKLSYPIYNLSNFKGVKTQLDEKDLNKIPNIKNKELYEVSEINFSH